MTHASFRISVSRQTGETRSVPKPRNLFVSAMALVLLLSAGFIAWREVEPLTSFRPAQAIVLSAGRSSSPRRTSMPSKGVAGHRRGFVMDVTYRYRVGGLDYIGSQYARTNLIESRSASARRLAGLRPGALVTAWYDSRNPAECVLERASNPLLLAITAVMSCFAGIVWLFAGAVRVHPPEPEG